MSASVKPQSQSDRRTRALIVAGIPGSCFGHRKASQQHTKVHKAQQKKAKHKARVLDHYWS